MQPPSPLQPLDLFNSIMSASKKPPLKAPAKKRVKKVHPVAGCENSRRRTPNFVPEEDEWLCDAWHSATVNPAIGNNQRGETFWADVHLKYGHCRVAAVDTDVWTLRSMEMLKTRFMKCIQPTVSLFNKYYKRANDNIPSGHPELHEEIMKLAMAEYEVVEGRPFLFELCVPILHLVPKFDPKYGGEIQFEPCGDDASIEALPPYCHAGREMKVMGAKLVRPIGCKAAKRKIKQEKIEEKEKKAETVDGDIQLMVRSAISKDVFDKKAAMVGIWVNCGQMEKAMELALELQSSLEDEDKENVESTTTRTYSPSTEYPPPKGGGGSSVMAVAPRPPSSIGRTTTTAVPLSAAILRSKPVVVLTSSLTPSTATSSPRMQDSSSDDDSPLPGFAFPRPVVAKVPLSAGGENGHPIFTSANSADV
jgi:hypothetical protein